MNHYEILEVSPNASPEVIRAAYRSLMQRYHPDKNPGNADIAERAVLVARAYEVLSDSGKRAEYDIWLGQSSNPLHGRGQGIELVTRRPAAAENARAPYVYVALLLVFGILSGWYMLSPSKKQQSPGAEIRVIRQSLEGKRLTERQLQEKIKRIDEILSENPDLRREDAKERAQAISARTIPAYISNLTVSLPGSDAASLQHALSIPTLDVVVGTFDSEKFMNHLADNNEYIARKLGEKLVHAKYQELISREGKDYLKRLILDAFGEITGARRDEEYPSSYTEAPGRYGVVDVLLPDSFSVQ